MRLCFMARASPDHLRRMRGERQLDAEAADRGVQPFGRDARLPPSSAKPRSHEPRCASVDVCRCARRRRMRWCCSAMFASERKCAKARATGSADSIGMVARRSGQSFEIGVRSRPCLAWRARGLPRRARRAHHPHGPATPRPATLPAAASSRSGLWTSKSIEASVSDAGGA